MTTKKGPAVATTRCARCTASYIGTAQRGHKWFIAHLVAEHDIRPLAAHLVARLLFVRRLELLEEYVSARRAA